MDQDEYQSMIKELQQFIALNAEEHRGHYQYLAMCNLLIVTKMKMEKEQQARKLLLTSSKKISESRGASSSGKKSKVGTSNEVDSIETILSKLKLLRENLAKNTTKKIQDNNLDKYGPESAKVVREGNSKKETIMQELPKRIFERSMSFERTTGIANTKKYSFESDTPPAEMSRFGKLDVGKPNKEKMPKDKAIASKPKTIYTADPSKLPFSKNVPDRDLEFIPKLVAIRRSKTISGGEDNTMIPTPSTGRSYRGSSIPSPIRNSPISPPDNRSIQEPKPTKDMRSKIKPPSRSSSIPNPSRNYSFSMHDKSNSQSPRSSIERASTSSNSSRTSSIPKPTQYKLSLLHEQSKSDNSKKITDQTLISTATKRSSSIPTPVRRNIFGPQDKSEVPKSQTERISRPSVAKKSTSKPGESRSHSASPYVYNTEPLYFACVSSKCPQVQYNKHNKRK